MVSVGILRGYNDTRAILCVTLVSYWMLALPLGYTLGRTHLWGDPVGPQGFVDGVYRRRIRRRRPFGQQGARVGAPFAFRV